MFEGQPGGPKGRGNRFQAQVAVSRRAFLACLGLVRDRKHLREARLAALPLLVGGFHASMAPRSPPASLSKREAGDSPVAAMP